MAPRWYYPGFFGALFLVLLRIAIGWHIYYEGREKIESQDTAQPFSSESYLRNATGPLAENFRNLVPDVDSLDQLNPDLLNQWWDEELRRASAHFQFNADQLAQAREQLDQTKARAESWFADDETADQIADYKEKVAQVREGRRQPPEMAFERDRLQDLQYEVETLRKELVAPIDQWTADLRSSWVALAEPDQLETAGELGRPPSSLDRIDLTTMYGLTICGLLLMAGLFTPVAALGAAGLLFLFYISMPPFPGLPPNPRAEGTYLIVNKTLIEMLALLALAATPSGLWFGVDRLLFGWIDRRNNTRAVEAREPQATA
ncbi:DoxX family protein [Tautonia marina]|uniref:DoxX family protein n=1 Tax=Tautonia marina TaxID=2653855 RepID=UPI0012605691|nr:DoxX family protein [Tautonia marina]